MAIQQDRPQPPCLALAAALFFTCALAWNISIDDLSLSSLICGFVVVFLASLIWIAYGRDVFKRVTPVLSLSLALATGGLLWLLQPGNWLVLLLSVSSVAIFSYLFLSRFLRSIVEVIWAHSLLEGVQASQLETWRTLLYTQVPLSAKLVRRIVIEKLGMDRSAEAVKLLSDAAINHPDGTARWQALRALSQVTDEIRIDALCAIWATTRDLDLAELLIRKQWCASSATTPNTFVLSALLLGKVDSLQAGKAELVPALAQATSDIDPLIAGRAFQVLGGLKNTEAQEALCRLVIEQENPLAQAAALATGYLPRDEKQRALFLFMTEQWERYASHDFDRRLMHRSYFASSQSLQQRIREKLRVVGRIDFLPIVAGEGSEENALQFDAGESEVLVQTLITNREWATLWQRVFDLPFQWSVRAVEALAQSGWEPANAEERAVLGKLAALVANGLSVKSSEIRSLFPLQARRASVRIPGLVNTVAFAPIRPVLAFGTGQGKVILWNYQTARRELVLSNFEHPIGEVVFSPDGTLLCTERVNEEEPSSILVFQYPWNDSPFHLGLHLGSVTSLVPMSSSRVLSAWDDGTVILWDIAAREEIHRCQITPPAYSLRVSPDETQFLALHQRLDLFSLPDLQIIAGIDEDTLFSCAAFAPDNRSLFASKSSRRLHVYQKSAEWSDRWIARQEPLTEYSSYERVEAVESLNRLSLVISAGTGGEIRFFSINNYESLGNFTVPDGQITSLNVSPNEFFMAVGSDKEMMTLWDLRTLATRLLLDRPFAQAEVRIIPIINAIFNDAHLSLRARQVLQFAQAILLHRFRYDIEIEESPSIALGEFDIELG